MKKVLTLILIVGLIALGFSANVFAADVATLNATPDKTTIKAGEELKVTLSLGDFDATAMPVITSVSTKIEYDTNIFETIAQADISTDYMPIYNDNDDTHELTIVSTNAIAENAKIATITFRAKSNIVSTNTTISFKSNTANENKVADTTVKITIGAEEIPNVTLDKIEVTKKPTKIAYKIGEKFDTTGMEVTATYSDKTTKVITAYTYEPMGELKEENNKITITYKEGAVTKTAEQKIYVNETGELPATGLGNYTIAIFAVVAITLISLIKAKKYNNV